MARFLIAAGLVCTVFAGFLSPNVCSADTPAVFVPPGRPRLPLTDEKLMGWSQQFTKTIKDMPAGDWKPARLGMMTIPKDMTCAWAERAILVPADWAGRRVVLHITWLAMGAKVFVNGKEAGEILGYGGEVDITELIQAGKANNLRLAFPRRDSEQLDTLDRFSQGIAVSVRNGRDEQLMNVGVGCGGEEFYLESQSPDLVVEDVWYQTYVRGYQRINALTTIRVAKPLSGLKAKLTIQDAATGAVVKEAVYPLPMLNLGRNEVPLPMEALGLKLWDIRQPNLYIGQVTVLDAAGKEIDRTHPVTFGIREFWMQGRRFNLNNHPVNFVLDTPYMKYANIEEMFAAGGTLIENNPVIISVVLGNQNETASTCDRLGMGFMAAGVVANSMFDGSSPDIKDPAVITGYRTWVENHVRRLRNHPSILFWGLTACCGGGHTDFRWDILGRDSGMGWNFPDVNTAHLTHREIDPTRLTFLHGGPLVSDVSTGLIYFNHIPTQEVEDWLNDWSVKGDRPIMAMEFSGNPLDVDYTKGPFSLVTEYAASLAGDNAYAEESDDYVRYQTIEWPSESKSGVWGYEPYKYSPLVVSQIIDMQERVLRVWRQRGVATVNWLFKGGKTDPKRISNAPIWDSYTNLIKPTFAWLGGPVGDMTAKEHDFYSGERVEKSVLLCRDLPGNEEWEIAWTVRPVGGDATVGSGKSVETITSFSRQAIPISFTAPAVDRPTMFRIEFKTAAAGTEIAKGSFEFTVHPRPAPIPAAPVAKPGWGIVDPEGETTAWLRSQGVEVATLDKAKRPLQVLLLGRRALKYSTGALPYTAKEVEDGLRVVVFEQNCDDLSPLGFRLEDRAPRQVFPRIADHPFLKGIVPEDLRYWRGEATLFSPGPERDQTVSSAHFFRCGNKGAVASTIIETPQYGPFWPAINCEFDLGYSPLLEWRHGKGSVTFCTLDLTGRVGNDPGATIIARNLIGQLSAPAVQAPQSKIVAGLSAKSVEQLKNLGFSAVQLPSKLDPKTHIVAIEAADKGVLAAKRSAIADFVKAGGDALVLHADAALLGDEFFGGRVTVTETVCSRAARTVEGHPLLSGVGPQDIHWREPVKMSVLASTDKDFTPLIGGFAGTLAMGKGRIIFLQPSIDAMKDLSATKALPPLELNPGHQKNADPPTDKFHNSNRKRSLFHVERLHSQVLGNLGARGSEEMVDRIMNMRRTAQFTAVNRWMYLGLFPPGPAPTDPKAQQDPLDQDYTPFLAKRDVTAKMKNARGQTIEWQTPTDYNNGIGIDGKMELSKRYPRQLMDSAIAVTQVWSSKPRKATIYFGADWWLKIMVNGETVFWTSKEKGGWAFGQEFAMNRQIQLKEGWNDVVCIVASGSVNHTFWFKMSDPGDLRIEQKITTPAGKPAHLPPPDRLADEFAPTGFSFYAEPPLGDQDPFMFIPW